VLTVDSASSNTLVAGVMYSLLWLTCSVLIFSSPLFLPNPQDGSLYTILDDKEMLELPFSIPKLAEVSPCQSSDGKIYNGSILSFT
jgi:hypothetical protein